MSTAILPAEQVSGTWESGTMPAAAILERGVVGVVELPIPAPASGQTLVRVSHVGICGSDLELLHGTSSYLRDGRASYPHVFGHEWTGTVVAVCGDADPDLAPGARVVGHTMISCGACRSCQEGRRNLCLRMRETGLYGQQGAAATFIRVPSHTLTAVAPSVTDTAAAMVEPAVTVLAALHAVSVSRTDSVVVVGTGTIGLLAVQAAVDRSARVDVVGVDPVGLDLARSLGAEGAYRPGQAPARGHSVAVEASGSIDGVHTALETLGTGGRLAAIGVPSGALDGLDVGRMVLDGLTVHGIRHGLDHYREAIGLFDRGVLEADPLVRAVLPLSAAADGFALLESGSRGAPKVLLDVAAAH